MTLVLIQPKPRAELVPPGKGTPRGSTALPVKRRPGREYVAPDSVFGEQVMLMKCSSNWLLPWALLAALACKSSDERQSSPSASQATPAQADSSAVSPSGEPRSVSVPEVYRVPVGPPLTILPGKGLGPVRFGATLQTIERLMEAPCTEKTETDAGIACRYQPHAVDFWLEDGLLTRIHVHGVEREFVPGKGLEVANTYGVFNGGFVDGFKLGMYPKFSRLGEPSSKEEATPGRFPTVEKHHFENMILEYDKLKNGNIVLGGVVLTKPTKAPTKATGAAKTP